MVEVPTDLSLVLVGAMEEEILPVAAMVGEVPPGVAIAEGAQQVVAMVDRGLLSLALLHGAATCLVLRLPLLRAAHLLVLDPVLILNTPNSSTDLLRQTHMVAIAAAAQFHIPP